MKYRVTRIHTDRFQSIFDVSDEATALRMGQGISDEYQEPSETLEHNQTQWTVEAVPEPVEPVEPKVDG